MWSRFLFFLSLCSLQLRPIDICSKWWWWFAISSLTECRSRLFFTENRRAKDSDSHSCKTASKNTQSKYTNYRNRGTGSPSDDWTQQVKWSFEERFFPYLFRSSLFLEDPFFNHPEDFINRLGRRIRLRIIFESFFWLKFHLTIIFPFFFLRVTIEMMQSRIQIHTNRRLHNEKRQLMMDRARLVLISCPPHHSSLPFHTRMHLRWGTERQQHQENPFHQ